MSRSRHGVLLSKYSEFPSRYTRRVARTSYHSIPSSSPQSLNVTETSANPTGLRVSAPLKITSAISSPRSDLADCSPSAQRTASRTLDFPQPFGPTIAVMPSWKLKIVLSANDLKPSSSSDCKCIVGHTLGPWQRQYSKVARLTSGKSHNWKGFWQGATTGYWAFVLPHKTGIARTLACFVASPLATRGEDEGEGFGQINGFLGDPDPLPCQGEASPCRRCNAITPHSKAHTPLDAAAYSHSCFGQIVHSRCANGR